MQEAVAPVFAALGRATTWLGPAGNGTRAKLVFNHWLADRTETTAEALSFARQLDLDPALIGDLLESTPRPGATASRAGIEGARGAGDP
jgi:3-hydroxyisobutyrate dehydrogenase